MQPSEKCAASLKEFSELPGSLLPCLTGVCLGKASVVSQVYRREAVAQEKLTLQERVGTNNGEEGPSGGDVATLLMEGGRRGVMGPSLSIIMAKEQPALIN